MKIEALASLRCLRLLLTLCLWLASLNMAHAETIKLSIGLTVEPYIFTEEDNGFELDIVRSALALEGIGVEFVRAPLNRASILLDEGLVDGVMTVKATYDQVAGHHFSDEYIEYQNLVVSMLTPGTEICSFDDLSDKQVVAFQNASSALGQNYASSVETNPDYQELADQERQVTLFFLGRADAIVIDWRIFEYFRQQLKTQPLNLPVQFHTLFEPSRYRIAFSDPLLRNRFNRGLKKIHSLGLYQGFIDEYFVQSFDRSSFTEQASTHSVKP